MNRLKELREAAGESRERLAVDLGVSKEAVDYWEKQSIPAQRLRPLARRYGVSISHLLRDDPSPDGSYPEPEAA